MKKALFYTFIAQYAVLFIATGTGLLGVVAIPHLDKLIGLLVTETAVVLIPLLRAARLFGEEVPEPVLAPTTEPSGAKADPPTSSPRPSVSLSRDLAERISTPEAYFQIRELLRDRFSELETFQKRSHGEIVTWRGRVGSVSTLDRSVSIYLEPLDDTARWTWAFFAHLPMAMKDRAFALRQGDVIEVMGLLATENMPQAPTVDAEDFHLVEGVS